MNPSIINRFAWPSRFLALLIAMMPLAMSTAEDRAVPANFQRENLVAWCIVPFDAKQRGPAERAEMIRRLGMKRVAYDWRAKHIAEFEEEILQYKKHGIDYFAFWSWHDAMQPLIEKHGITPQIWAMSAQPKSATQTERITEAAASLMPLVEKTKQLGLALGIYNHGAWAGEPENMVAVCQYLRREHDADHVGIVYNFHHGHEHMSRFAKTLKEIQPYLLCLNLNGMADAEAVRQDAGKHKIVTIGQGKHEKAMIEKVIASGYTGPIGILDHRSQLDAEESLRLNLDGLERILAK